VGSCGLMVEILVYVLLLILMIGKKILLASRSTGGYKTNRRRSKQNA
jgi:hypothetical protein